MEGREIFHPNQQSYSTKIDFFFLDDNEAVDVKAPVAKIQEGSSEVSVVTEFRQLPRDYEPEFELRDNDEVLMTSRVESLNGL